MPSDLEEYRSLCESLDFLVVDIISQNDLSAIFYKMRLYPFLGSSLTLRKEAIRESRDAAFQLVYLFLMDELDPTDFDGKCSNTAFQAVEYVMKKSWFSDQTRRMVREAYNERFTTTKKPKKRLEYVATWLVYGSGTECSSSDEE
ncbi:hypothetical protein CGCSCA5_v004648 [Colletotrichum siamense]|nr:hypothetical protein CGCSCA5_v004648 [Colletotrichum siamense]